MSKIFPSTNRISADASIEAETLNKELRSIFELGNGGLDEQNFEGGNDVFDSDLGLRSIEFDNNAWTEYFTYGGEPTFTELNVIEDDNLTRSDTRFKRYGNNDAHNYGQGLCYGQAQISYQIATNITGDNGVFGFVKAYNQISLSHKFSININGHRVGETDFVGEGPAGTVNIPFHFYHPGGRIVIELFAAALGGGAPQMGEDYRLRVNNAYVWGVIRKR